MQWYDDSKATNPHADRGALRGLRPRRAARRRPQQGPRPRRRSGATATASARGRRHRRGRRRGRGRVRAARCRSCAPTSMHDAVRAAAARAQPGDAVLLSPACASFDWYDELRRARRRLRRARSQRSVEDVPHDDRDRAGAADRVRQPRPRRAVTSRGPATQRRPRRAASVDRVLLVRDRRGAQRRRPGDGAVGVVGGVAHRLRLAVVLLRPPAAVDRCSASIAFVVASRFDYRRWRALVAPAARRQRRCCSSSCSCPASGSTCRRLAPLARRRACSASSRASSPSSRCCCSRADLLSRRGARARTTGGACVRPVAARARRRSALLVMLRARPRLDDRARARRARACSSSAASGAATSAALVGARRRSRSRVLAIAEPYRRARHAHVPRSVRRRQRTPATRSRSRSSRSAAAGSPASASAPAGRSGSSCPNAHTDFIFAIIGEELGLVGCLLVLGAVRRASRVLGVRAALRAPDRFGALLAAGVTAWIVGQAVINIGAVVGLLPVTGHPAAVPLVRRLVARHHDARRRASSSTSPARVARAGAATCARAARASA